MAEDWRRIAQDDEIGPGTLHTHRVDDLQLALGRTAAGKLFCLDNRCPHEGYPLVQGYLDEDCSLTCAWHNWKFDVRDGRCTLGGEAVRAFPVRLRDGAVEVDIAPPDRTAEIPRLLDSLLEGVHKNESGRAIRDAVRLLLAGQKPEPLLAELAAHDAQRAEYGSSHVVAVAADCARLIEGKHGTDGAYAIAPVIDLAGETNVRRSAHELPPPASDAPADAAALGTELRDAVEREDATRAIALLRAAFRRGIDRATIDGWMWTLLSDHFLGFGHPLIYMVKAVELMDRANGHGAEDIWIGMLRGIAFGTREDTLPYMRSYSRRLDEIEGELESLWASARQDAAVPFDTVACRDAVLDAGSPDEAFEAVLEPLRRGVSAAVIARSLVGAGAHRLLRFDIAHEQNPDVAENWLWATHRFTTASAIRNAVERFDDPAALRFLFHGVMFIHSGRRMDLEVEERVAVDGSTDAAPTKEAFATAIATKDTETALAVTRALIARNDIPTLRQAIGDLILSDPVVRPIVLAHVIKTPLAALEEYDALADHPDRIVPLLAAVRFLSSPVQERRIRPLVHTSIRWVATGQVPRKLTQ